MHETAVTSGSAFGLAIQADFAIPGLRPAPPAERLPATELRLGDAAALEGAWPDVGTWRVSEERLGPRDPDRTIDAHPEAGYRLYARYFGRCVITADGDRLLCVPPAVASWRWQRFLVGRCLPLAAMLRGHEVLHAGAVDLDGRVVAIIGPTGAGKTSLTMHLVFRGATLVTDDVLAIDATADGVCAHPGFPVVNLRVGEHDRLGTSQRRALGTMLGRTGRHKLHFAVPVIAEARPLHSIYFLVPGDALDRATISPIDVPEPARLLASTFSYEVRRPEHLTRLLDVCSRMADEVPMYEVARSAREDAATLAGRLLAHATTGAAA